MEINADLVKYVARRLHKRTKVQPSLIARGILNHQPKIKTTKGAKNKARALGYSKRLVTLRVASAAQKGLPINSPVICC